MRIELNTDEIKDIILDYLNNTFTQDVMGMIKKDDLHFKHETGDDVNGYYMEETGPLIMEIKGF